METKPKSIALSFVYIPDFVFDAPVKMIYSGKNIEIPEEVSTSVSDLYNPDTIGYATGNVIKEVETNRNKNVFTIWRTIFIVSEVITLFAITPIISYYMVSMYKSSMIKRIFFMKKRSFVNECFMSVFLIIPINILGCILFPLIISKGVDSENIFYLIVSTVVLIIEVYLVLNYSAKKIYSKNLDKLKFGENI